MAVCRETCASHTQMGRHGIVIPVYPPHFGYAQVLVWSACAMVTDPETAAFHFVLTSSVEELEFCNMLQDTLARYGSCRIQWHTLSWEVAQAARDGAASVQPLDRACQRLTQNKTSNRYDLQAAKKLYALLYLDFDTALILDAEATFVKPTSVQADLFGRFRSAPSYWMATKQGMPRGSGSHLRRMAHVLTGRAEWNFAAINSSSTHAFLAAVGLVSGRSRAEDGSIQHAWAAPRVPNFHVVQHWFYERQWLHALAVRTSSDPSKHKITTPSASGHVSRILVLAGVHRVGAWLACARRMCRGQGWHLRDAARFRLLVQLVAVVSELLPIL